MPDQPFQVNREELAWASGLFEGEGCFSIQHDKKGKRAIYPIANIKMVDRDVLLRFQKAVGLGTMHGPYKQVNPKWQPTSQWVAFGFEKVQAILAMLWHGLSPRRQQRAIEVLNLNRHPQDRVLVHVTGGI